MKNKRVYKIIAYNILYITASLFMYYFLNMKASGLSFCPIGLVLINAYHLINGLEKAKNRKFVQRYESIHKRSLSKATINYKAIFTINSSILLALIFGFIICFSAIGILYEQSIAGVFVFFIGMKFILMPFEDKTTLKIAANGIWTSDYQFIFINDIQEIYFKRYIGKSSSTMNLKIKDPALYAIKNPYLSIPIGGTHQIKEIIPILRQLFPNTRIRQDI